MKKVPFLHRAPFKEHNLNSWKFSMNQSYKNFRSFVEFRGNNQRLFRGGVKRVRDRESASRVCAAATIAVARGKTERQETVSGRGNNVLESCPGPWGALRLPSLWSLETRLCLSFFLSFPACDNPFPPHLALRVISLSANGAWVFRSIERWPSKRAWWTSKPALQRCRAAYRAAVKRKKVEVERLAIVAPPVSYLTFIIIFGNDSVDVQRTNAEKAGTNNFTPEANFVPRADHLP